MGVLDVVSLAILAIYSLAFYFLILIVAAIPGVLAKKRHSPWAEAINVAGWVGVLAAYLDAGIDCSVCASSDRRRRTNCNQPDGDHRNRYCNCQYLPAPHHSSEQYSCFNFRLIGQANGINDLAGLCNMHYKRISNSTPPKVTIDGLMLVALLTVGSLPFFSRARVKNETIEASAIGTSTQLGQVVGVSIEIYDFSTPDDHQLLVTSLEKGQNSGLVNTLSKMKSVGHCFITGTLGYDASYIRVIPTPTGRKIRWVTNHQLRMGEVYADSQSHSFNLNSGEFDINDTDKKKSSGVLYPQCQLKEGQLQFQLAQNQWKLVDIIDWKGTAGVN